MSNQLNPTARLGQVLGSVARTFDDLGRQIEGGNLPDQWKRDGVRATEILADALGQDWLDRFIATSGTPYLKFTLAPRLLPQLASTVEFSARLQVLTGTPGLPDIRRQMRSQLEPGVMAHANLQLEVAGLERRRSGTVALEVDRGPGNWKPDVMLSHEGALITST